MSGIVKEQRVIFECLWDNLLCCAEVEISENLYGNSDSSGTNDGSGGGGGSGSTNSSSRAASIIGLRTESK